MKKILLLCFSAFGLSLAAAAQEPVSFTVDAATYTVTGAKTVAVTKVDTKATEIIIPETVSNEGTTYTVTSVGERAFNYAAADKIVLANTITEIGYCGVYSTEASVIELPTGLKTLGYSALGYNKSVLELTIPEGVTEIPGSCFSNNQKMATINLPSTIESIGSGAFYKVPIETFTLPANCKVLDKNIFQLAPNLKKVVLNGTLESMGEGVFRQCKKLTDINLEAAVKLKEIPFNLFVECELLSDITLPASVETIGANAFGNTSIAEFKVAAENKNFVVDNGSVYSTDKSILWLYPPKKADEEFVGAEGLRGIGGGAFYGSVVKRVTLPEGIVAIDNYAFCESTLESINLPNSILQIGEQAFAGTNLTTLVLPEKIVAVYDGLAAWSKQLTTVTIPADVRMIYNHAFQTCSALTTVICKGGEAPEIDSFWGEEDSPFGYIEQSQLTLHVPQGCAQSYKDKGWGDFFSNIVESEPAAFVPASTNPAVGAKLVELGAIELTFAEEATVVASNPEVELRKDSELTGDVISPDGGWMAANNSSDKKTVTVFPVDYDYFTSPIALENGAPYFIVIPAGTFKNAAGTTNQKIVITIEGTAPAFEVTGVTPASDSELTEIGAVEISFSVAAKVAKSNPEVTLLKGDATTGEAVEPDGGWMAANNSSDKKTVTVFPVDYDYYTSPIALESKQTYYMTIPAGTFTSDADVENEEIQLVYVGKDNSSVDSLAEAGRCLVYASAGSIYADLQGLGVCDVELYDMTGRRLDVRKTAGKAVFGVSANGVYVVRVISSAGTYVFKVKK